MPRGSVKTSFQKAKPKKRRPGRPKNKVITFTRTARPEINQEREDFLNEHKDIPWLKALALYQTTCDCNLNPWRLLAVMPTTDGYELYSCQNCLQIHRVNT